MVEVVGDVSRDGRWALVRLAVEGDRIVSAEAEGLDRPLAGLTLLEAAAVGGDELAVDALANALAQVFRAQPKPGRVAVAMSGGVDSAVALLRAGEDAIGVTLRLWLDPQGPDADRACCSDDRCETGNRDDPRGADGHVHDVVGPVDRGGVGEVEITVATEDPNGRRL